MKAENFPDSDKFIISKTAINVHKIIAYVPPFSGARCYNADMENLCFVKEIPFRLGSLEYMEGEENMTQNEILEWMKQMPLEEKIAQLYGTRIQDLMEGGEISREKCRQRIPHGTGHICQFASGLDLNAEQLVKMVQEIQEYMDTETVSKIPLMIHEEAITGVAAKGATVTPQMIGMSCSWDPSLVYNNARMTAENMKKMGCYYALSPMMDVITDARWGRGEEGYGEDVHLVSAFSEAFIYGLQDEGVGATAKHFAGYGVENQDLEYFRNEILPPFEAAVKSGKVKAVMPGYHSFHDVPCTASAFLLTKILREEWKFDGLIVSDYGAVSNLYRYYHAVSSWKEAAIAALEAGVDVEFPSGDCFPYLAEAVKEGRVSEERIDQSLYRVLALKNELGLLDGRQAPAHTEKIDLDPPQNRRQALDSAHKAVVLLKNDGILPLQPAYQKIAVIGPNGDSYYSMLGDYTWVGIMEFFHRIKGSRKDPEIVTLLQGLKTHLPDCEIYYERGCDWSAATDQITGTPMGDERGNETVSEPLEEIPDTDWNRAMELGRECDIIIAAVGENRYLCGECCDRSDVGLPGEQEKLVEELCGLGKPVILIVFGGRPMAIKKAAGKCAAVIYAWYPGEEGGNALADILSGAAEPSGKLTVTLPDTKDQVPICHQMGVRAERCSYPFGFGLTYTTFEYSDLVAEEEISTDQNGFEVTFCLANTGCRPGTEIAQIYAYSDGKSKKLIGFTRVELAPKESKKVKAVLDWKNFAEYDAEGNLHLYPQTIQVQIGASFTDIRLQAAIKIVGKERERISHES